MAVNYLLLSGQKAAFHKCTSLFFSFFKIKSNLSLFLFSACSQLCAIYTVILTWAVVAVIAPKRKKNPKFRYFHKKFLDFFFHNSSSKTLTRLRLVFVPRMLYLKPYWISIYPWLTHPVLRLLTPRLPSIAPIAFLEWRSHWADRTGTASGTPMRH